LDKSSKDLTIPSNIRK